MADELAGDQPAEPAATVVVVRDGPDGLETLMLRRAGRGAFAGLWVFPGGRVEDGDRRDDDLATARAAAVREAREEADLVLGEDALVPFSFWVPPVESPRRFATWFFVAAAPVGVDGDVEVDGAEIHDHVWIRPADALARRDAGEIGLVPPTWVTLWTLRRHASTASVLGAAQADAPERFATRMLVGDEGQVAAWDPDEAYTSGDLLAAGARHRLVMGPTWSYERT